MLKYKEKKRLFTKDGTAPFFDGFFNLDDSQRILKEVFNFSSKAKAKRLLQLIQNVIRCVASFYPEQDVATPGKEDEIALINELKQILDSASEIIN